MQWIFSIISYQNIVAVGKIVQFVLDWIQLKVFYTALEIVLIFLF